MIRVIIVMRRRQDLSRIREAVDSQEDLTVAGTGTDSYQAIRLAETLQPGVAVIDYQLDYGGLDVIALLKRRSPGTSIILLSSNNDGRHALDALFKGVSGYLLRKPDIDILVNVIYAVRAGGYYISQRIMAHIFQTLPKPNGAALRQNPDFSRASKARITKKTMLSRTELRILEFIGQGKGTKEIGEKLNLTMGTVRNYISTLMRKSGVHSRLEMARFVRNYGQPGPGGAPEKKARPAARPGPAKKFLPLLEASLNLEG
jgi:DNA-binding NarL/FixJ family response regulator